jgi:hypothetical protein
MMNARQLNLTLWTLAATLAGAATIALALGLFLPLRGLLPSANSVSSRAASTRPAARGLPTRDEVESIASLDLRRPLVDAPATAPILEARPARAILPASEQPPLTLVGTIGSSLAMLRTAGGEVEVRGVGEEAGGVKVTAIRPAQVDIEFNGRPMTLDKPKEPETPG